MARRETQCTSNSNLMVAKRHRSGPEPASVAYVSHILEPARLSPRMLRSTRLIDLVNTMDPKLVAAAFGMNPEASCLAGPRHRTVAGTAWHFGGCGCRTTVVVASPANTSPAVGEGGVTEGQDR
ncbi:hypothetical protein [Nonomuraea sp. NPDC050202]|jgi:hypothetical protein|uniref:hypothetical protein n=1 Tax=Nonomuraea sp. NPDC050202 TaxID=3155035 RepID=UPI0034046615